MSEVRLVVRDSERDWSGTIHGSQADLLIAGLAADPMTMAELELACKRFAHREADERFFSNLRPSQNDEPWDAGLVIVDLVARYVFIDSTYSHPGPIGRVCHHNGRQATDKSLPYHLADDWLFTDYDDNWRHTADARRAARAANPPPDTRSVTYGLPLLEFIARESFARFARRDEIAAAVRVEWIERARNWRAQEDKIPVDQVDPGSLTEEEIVPHCYPGEEYNASPFRDTWKEIHAAWLLTPREDLRGQSPREVMLADRDHIGWEVQDRYEAWSVLDKAPPGIQPSSYAYQHAGYGTHELVIHYELVRHLLRSCWSRLTELSESANAKERPDSLQVGDFLTGEVPRLVTERDAWLATPHREYRGKPPQKIINRERQRLPEVMTGHEAIVDCDCPLCQMQADMPGPVMWGLDGSGMDDEFVFDISCRTQEDWDRKEREYEEMSRSIAARNAAMDVQREQMGLEGSEWSKPGPESAWSRTFSVGDLDNVPLGVRLFDIGGKLANIICELREDFDRENTPPEVQGHIDQLNRHWSNLRGLLTGANSLLAESLLQPTIDNFIETLDNIGETYPDQSFRCELLADDLQDRLLSPPPSEDDWMEYPYPDSDDDSELPF